MHEEEGEEGSQQLPLQLLDGDLGGTSRYLSQGQGEPFHVLGEGAGGSRDDDCLRNGFSSVRWSDP